MDDEDKKDMLALLYLFLNFINIYTQLGTDVYKRQVWDNFATDN